MKNRVCSAILAIVASTMFTLNATAQGSGGDGVHTLTSEGWLTEIPGNSAAGRDVTGLGSDPNCIGDIYSRSAQKEDGYPGFSGGDPNYGIEPSKLSLLVSVAAGIGFIPFDDCLELPLP